MDAVEVVTRDQIRDKHLQAQPIGSADRLGVR